MGQARFWIQEQFLIFEDFTNIISILLRKVLQVFINKIHKIISKIITGCVSFLIFSLWVREYRKVENCWYLYQQLALTTKVTISSNNNSFYSILYNCNKESQWSFYLTTDIRFHTKTMISCSQFHQHFTSSFCANILSPKSHKAKL